MKKSKILIATGLVLLMIALIVLTKYFYDLSYKGDEEIRLISNGDKITSFEEIINNKDFKGNVLYIDLWGTSCGPCLQEFKFMPDLKERYKDKPVKFVYLSTPYLHIDDEQKWKNMIKKFDLSGYHLLMNMDLFNNIWDKEGIKDKYMIPHYILVDKDGKISDINAARPSNKNELHNQLEKLL